MFLTTALLTMANDHAMSVTSAETFAITFDKVPVSVSGRTRREKTIAEVAAPDVRIKQVRGTPSMPITAFFKKAE